MAASSTNKQVEPRHFHDRMAPFPCIFNMPCFDHPIRSNLKHRKEQLLRWLEEGLDTEEEEKKARNALTWIYHQLGLVDLATAMNETVLMDTGYECIVAVGNFVFMDWLRTGQISDHYKLLDDMKEKATFGENVLNAKAEQAFCLAKLGNPYNLMSAINLYEESLMFLEKDVWRYSLGLAYRRLGVIHGLEKYSGNKLNKDICFQKAKDCFIKITKSSDNRLKALGFANLAGNYSDTDSEMYARVDIATQMDSNTSEVYLACGRPLIYDNPMQAVSLLEKAVELRPQRSVCHHQLGKAYIRQMVACRLNTREIQDKAQKHLELAYETSAKQNIAPLVDLARLFQRMKKTDAAQKEAFTVLQSRAGGCFAFIPTQNAHMILFSLNTSVNRGRQHLLLSLLTSIALVREEASQNELHAVWSQLFEKDQVHADVTKLKTSSEVLCRNFEKNKQTLSGAPRSISNFVRDGRIHDVSAVVSEAEELLRRCQNEEALLFIEFVSLRPRMDIAQLQELHLQLLLTQAGNCLDEYLNTSSVFFRKAFNISVPDIGRSRDKIENDNDVAIKIDMIMVFNDSVKNASTLCSSTAYGLEDAVGTLFGLKVAFNPILDITEDGGEMAAFVDKHLIDVIVIVFEGDGTETQYLLDKVGPFIADVEREAEDVTRRPRVVLIQCQEQPALNLPEDLKRLPCLSLGLPGDAFPNLFSLKETQELADKSWSVRGVLEAYFESNTKNVLRLFKHLTG